jgi:hypothetical protein
VSCLSVGGRLTGQHQLSRINPGWIASTSIIANCPTRYAAEIVRVKMRRPLAFVTSTGVPMPYLAFHALASIGKILQRLVANADTGRLRGRAFFICHPVARPSLHGRRSPGTSLRGGDSLNAATLGVM